jgi:hypothetical protein
MQPEKAPTATVDHSRAKGMSQLPTSEIALAPKFLDELKQIAPKPKRSKLWWILLLGVASGGVWLGVTAKGRALVARLRHQAPAETTAKIATIASDAVTVPTPVPSDSAAPVASAAPSAAAATVSASATPSASASAKPSTKKPSHKHH